MRQAPLIERDGTEHDSHLLFLGLLLLLLLWSWLRGLWQQVGFRGRSQGVALRRSGVRNQYSSALFILP